jgi:Contractile injection system tube protein
MTWLPDIPQLAVAHFEVRDGAGQGRPFDVQFNPASLEYTLSSEFDDRNSANAARQFVKKTSGKLTMTLPYDTTLTGADVRGFTGQVAKLLQPAADGKKKFAPKVLFSWGSFSFRGVVEQYRETLDFFSAEGVPLRAAIVLTLASQEVEFNSSADPAPRQDTLPRSDPVLLPAGSSPAGVANQLGDPRAARGIATLSGAVSLTAGAGEGLAVGGSVSIRPAKGLSFGAGLTATAGPAFAGLGTSPPTQQVSVDDARTQLLGGPVVSTSPPLGFSPGGRAASAAGGSLSADVGARLRFGSGS